jgi:hypothetical protein
MEVRGQLHASAALPPGKCACTHCIGMGLRFGLDVVEKRKIFPLPKIYNKDEYVFFKYLFKTFIDVHILFYVLIFLFKASQRTWLML